MEELQAGFQARLKGTTEAVAYLLGRLPGWTLDDLLSAGLGLTPATFPAFADRLTFPLYGWDGRPVAFRGRVWRSGDNRAKTIPWPSGTIPGWPFGVSPANYATLERLRFAIIVEGEMDCLSLWRCGIPAVSAGQSGVTVSAAATLAALLDGALVWADTDAAGQRGAETSCRYLQAQGVRTAQTANPLGCGKDVNDLLCLFGPEVVRRTVCRGVQFAGAPRLGFPVPARTGR